MAEKVFVEVVEFAVAKIFDKKHEAKAKAAMKKAAEAAVKSGFTLGKPKDKAQYWKIDGSLVSLAPNGDGKMLEGKCSISVSAVPKGGIKSVATGSAATKIAGADKVDAGDVEAIAEACAEGAMKRAVAYMKGATP